MEKLNYGLSNVFEYKVWVDGVERKNTVGLTQRDLHRYSGKTTQAIKNAICKPDAVIWWRLVKEHCWANCN